MEDAGPSAVEDAGPGAMQDAGPGASPGTGGVASPGSGEDAGPGPGEVTFRRPTEADHARIVGVVDEWWGGRRMRSLLPRLWLQHFSGTSWVAEEPDGRLVGFVVAFVSADDPTTGYVHMIAADPNRRRRGIGRALYGRVFDDLGARGVRRVTAITWPGNRASVAFHRSIGFRVEEGPGAQPIYGTPAYADYDGPGDDRVVFVREL
jgi:ribosomal protein S18 acetylase RimI-like enzyme